MCKTTNFRALFYNAMIDVYSALWNEKHKLLSLLWKLQGGLLTAESVLFGSFIKFLSMSATWLELRLPFGRSWV